MFITRFCKHCFFVNNSVKLSITKQNYLKFIQDVAKNEKRNKEIVWKS